MIYFDLESYLGTLYKIEAITWENGKPKDKFSAVTNADMPDAVRRITGITHEQSLTGTDERETVFAFWNFLHRLRRLSGASKNFPAIWYSYRF